MGAVGDVVLDRAPPTTQASPHVGTTRAGGQAAIASVDYRVELRPQHHVDAVRTGDLFQLPGIVGNNPESRLIDPAHLVRGSAEDGVPRITGRRPHTDQAERYR